MPKTQTPPSPTPANPATEEVGLFKSFASNVHASYAKMAKGELYTVDVENIFDLYLAAFPAGTNPIFRTNTEHDCNCCKQFVRNLGKVVSIDPATGFVQTVWDDYSGLPYPYDVVGLVMAEKVRTATIKGVFRTKERQYGTAHNFSLTTGQRWNHFHGKVTNLHFSETPEAARGEKDTIAHVLRRGLEEIKQTDLDTVLELIDANGLYRGDEHRGQVIEFRALQRKYEESANKDIFVWQNLTNRAARFRNTVIGTLLIDLAEGKDLEKAVKSFEAKVAPQNYKRPTAVITPSMVEAAMAKIEELGLKDSLERRFARIEDVSVNDVLWVDGAAKAKMKDALTETLLAATKPKATKVKTAQEISGDAFLSTVVPLAKSIQLFVENKHLGNFVSLTAPVHEDAGNLFKWNNNFAWEYVDGVTDAIKARVKAAGGKVDAFFRTSLAWRNLDDLDLHAETSLGEHIYYGSKRSHRSRGQLDVDMNVCSPVRNAVENIFWNDDVPDGTYVFKVNQYTRRDSVDVGFTLELEFAGVTHQYSYAKALPDRHTVTALTVTVKDNKMVSVVPGAGVVGGDIPTEKWGITTGQAVPVQALMLSPNYWGGNASGNKHLIFVLEGAKNPDSVRGIYNEFLRPEFELHRKVFEILGAKTKAPYSDQQLSGLGFSSTRKDEVTAVVDGRPYRIKF